MSLLVTRVLLMADQVDVSGSDSVTHDLRLVEEIDSCNIILGSGGFIFHEMGKRSEQGESVMSFVSSSILISLREHGM